MVKVWEANLAMEEAKAAAGRKSRPADVNDAKEEIKDAKRRIGELKEVLRRLRNQILGATYYKQGMLSEVLIGAEPRDSITTAESEQIATRMLKLAGIEEE